MQGDYYKPGDWNAICDICGFRFKASELIKNWKNEYVCRADFEPRHPQTYIKVPDEHVGTPWARPEGEDVYIDICYLWERSAYAGLATAGCAQAGFVPSSYDFLFNLKNNGTPLLEDIEARRSAIPHYMIPGYSIPSFIHIGHSNE